MSARIVYETHATTFDNENGVATGWLPGRLSPTGIENARALGERRKHDGVDVVISSDLARAIETVDVAFDGCPIPRLTDARLREVDYGDLNGSPVEVIDKIRQDHLDVPFRGGQSYRAVTDGVRALLDELRSERPGQRVLLVGHAATKFSLDYLLAGRPLRDAVSAPFAWREGWEYALTDGPDPW